MKSREEYPHIPPSCMDKFTHQSTDFLKNANSYFRQQNKIKKMKEQIQSEETILETIQQQQFKLCKHNYVMQPREYASPREWICSICDHYY